jgi:hypothetical protein
VTFPSSLQVLSLGNLNASELDVDLPTHLTTLSCEGLLVSCAPVSAVSEEEDAAPLRQMKL